MMETSRWLASESATTQSHYGFSEYRVNFAPVI